MTIDEIAALEQQWVGRVQVPARGVYFDWQPAPVAMFAVLLEECLPYVPSDNKTFLDVGCGIGTKGLLAKQAGLDAYGLDRVPEYVSEAIRIGIVAWEGLAEDYDAYARYGMVYINHPLVPIFEEAVLERDIHSQMASGSVLMTVNYDVVPAGWAEIARVGDWNAGWVKQ
jgi:SAM-dependent methyltransferase